MLVRIVDSEKRSDSEAQTLRAVQDVSLQAQIVHLIVFVARFTFKAFCQGDYLDTFVDGAASVLAVFLIMGLMVWQSEYRDGHVRTQLLSIEALLLQ